MYRLSCVLPERMVYKFHGKYQRIYTENVELSVELRICYWPVGFIAHTCTSYLLAPDWLIKNGVKWATYFAHEW